MEKIEDLIHVEETALTISASDKSKYQVEALIKGEKDNHHSH